MKTTEAFECVRHFHEANNQLAVDEARATAPFSVRLLRARLMIEELGELASAIHERNEVETADALADLLYVVVGTAVSYGHDLFDTWRAYPSISPSPSDDAEHRFRWLHRLTRAVDYVVTAMEAESFGQLRAGLQKLVHDVNRCAEDLAIPLREVFLAVHAANMTKRLGGATDGKKYGAEKNVVKGEGFKPADVEGILQRRKNAKVMGV